MCSNSLQILQPAFKPMWFQISVPLEKPVYLNPPQLQKRICLGSAKHCFRHGLFSDLCYKSLSFKIILGLIDFAVFFHHFAILVRNNDN